MKYPSFFGPGKTKEIVPSASAQTVRTWLQGAGGMLRANILLPPLESGQKCPMVIIMHGIMATKDIYPVSTLATMLQHEGIASISFDFNGHGGSYGKFRDMTVLNEVEDAINVVNYARSLSFVSKIGLAGHSQGGVVSALVAGMMPGEISAMVLLAPAAVCKDDALKGNIMGSTFDPACPPETLKVMMHKLGGEYIRVAQKLDIYGTVANYGGPICLIHGVMDKIVPVEYGKEFTRVCPQCEYHFFPKEGHMLNRNKASVIGISAGFLAARLLLC